MLVCTIWPPGLRFVSRAEGAVFTDPKEVQREIFAFCEATLQGQLATAEGVEAPTESGISFSPNRDVFGCFLVCLPRLLTFQRD